MVERHPPFAVIAYINIWSIIIVQKIIRSKTWFSYIICLFVVVLFVVDLDVFPVALWWAGASVVFRCPEDFYCGDNASDSENPEYYGRKNSEELRKKDNQQAEADED